jgi:PTH2 family peptidyl-tRNA hydrolase
MDDMPRLYILLRTDLGLSLGKAVAQGAHAAEGAIALADPETLAAWAATGRTKITLALPNEAAWHRAVADAAAAGLPCAPVRDAGRTEIAPDTPTAIGIGPCRRTDLAGVLRHLRLLA